MAKPKPPKRLFKSPDRISSYHVDRSPKARMKQMARDHEDVLQNIEFALVNGHRDDPRIDDHDVFEALRASRNGKEPEEPRAASLFAALAAVREMREDIDDLVWRQALQVVEESVKRHSDMRPGDTEYLKFAGRFII
jgi:hypothetical protein